MVKRYGIEIEEPEYDDGWTESIEDMPEDYIVAFLAWEAEQESELQAEAARIGWLRDGGRV